MKNKLTALIVSFYRYEYLEKCVKSLREIYPDINIVVGNNGPEDKEKEALCKKYDAEYYQLPFDCGICVGRNKLIDKIKTPYILISDDDFLYTEKAGVEKMFLLSQRYSALVGGRITEGGRIRNYQGFIHRFPRHFQYEALVMDNFAEYKGIKYKECDITFNYFVAPTKTLKDVRWDEKIKVAYEHSSFFLDAGEKGYKIYFTPDAIVVHKPPINIGNKREEYNNYRYYRSRKNDKKRFFNRYKIDYAIDMTGRKDVCDGNGISEVDMLITTFDRYQCLEKLLFSIAKYCPNARIWIGDQSRKFPVVYYKDLWEKLFDIGLQLKPIALNLPHDCGLSYARNFLIDNSRAGKKKLILEDDFIFTKETDVSKMIEFLDDRPDFGVIGGLIIENGDEVHFEHRLEVKDREIRHIESKSKWQDSNGLKFRKVDCVLNFAMFRPEVFADVKWDEEIKIHGEHTDFYLRLKDTKWKVAYSPEVFINHEHIRDDMYKQMRDRREFLKYVFNKWEVDKMVFVNGYTVEYNRVKDELINYRK